MPWPVSKGTGNTWGGVGALNKENLRSQLCRKIMVITEKQIEIGQGGDGFPLLLGLDGAPAGTVPKLPRVE